MKLEELLTDSIRIIYTREDKSHLMFYGSRVSGLVMLFDAMGPTKSIGFESLTKDNKAIMLNKIQAAIKLCNEEGIPV
jgi:hypothetical protein